jgi:hypothetical protein
MFFFPAKCPTWVLLFEITLGNNYQTDYEPYPGDLGRRMCRRHKIQSLEQLMALCPAARVLAGLTHPVTGFCNLSHLEFVVRVDLTGYPLDENQLDDEFLSMLEEANFVVKARKVTLSDYIPNLFQKVQEKITVVETV